jgi:CDP-4-dehydro-6-deoxyglucose reductase, E3
MSFTITVEPSKRAFQVNLDETILSAGIRQGVAMPYGCKDGACGSCKCLKLSGTVQHGTHQSKALSDIEEANGYVLTCCAVAQSDVVLESKQVTLADAFPIKKMPSRVTTMERLSDDVMRVTLQLPAAEPFQYHAGQYIEFLLRDGARRAYSMGNAAHTTEGKSIELHIRHMPGGKLTDQVFSTMKEKDIVRIEGPYGSFYLREDSDKPMILLASGTGFAPIKALIEQMEKIGSTRPATLYWGGRRPSDMYLDGWVKEKCAAMPHLKYVPVISNATADDAWTGRTGFVHAAAMADIPDMSGYQVYACGAPIVIESAQQQYVEKCGLPADEFYADSFLSEADKARAAVPS